jgi:predicted Zn-dependent peptidase
MRYSADILACILGDSSGSKAYWQLIDKGLADSASLGTDAMDGTGLVYAFGACDPRNLTKVAEVFRDILSKPAEFEDKDLQRAKTKFRTRLVLQGESSMRRLMAIGTDWLYRAEYSPLEDEQLKYKAVSKESISELLEKFPFAPMTEVRLVPK